MIKSIARVLKVLNSETEPAQISLAVCVGMIVGLTPLFSLHNLFLVLAMLILRVNLSAFLLSWLLFSGLAFLLDPLFHRIGLAVLTADALQGLWTALYNTSLFLLSKFYNTVVMGSLLFSAVLCVPLYLLSNHLIRTYRDHVLGYIRSSRLMTAIKASRIYSAYKSLADWGGVS